MKTDIILGAEEDRSSECRDWAPRQSSELRRGLEVNWTGLGSGVRHYRTAACMVKDVSAILRGVQKAVIIVIYAVKVSRVSREVKVPVPRDLQYQMLRLV